MQNKKHYINLYTQPCLQDWSPLSQKHPCSEVILMEECILGFLNLEIRTPYGNGSGISGYKIRFLKKFLIKPKMIVIMSDCHFKMVDYILNLYSNYLQCILNCVEVTVKAMEAAYACYWLAYFRLRNGLWTLLHRNVGNMETFGLNMVCHLQKKVLEPQVLSIKMILMLQCFWETLAYLMKNISELELSRTNHRETYLKAWNKSWLVKHTYYVSKLS